MNTIPSHEVDPEEAQQETILCCVKQNLILCCTKQILILRCAKQNLFMCCANTYSRYEIDSEVVQQETILRCAKQNLILRCANTYSRYDIDSEVVQQETILRCAKQNLILRCTKQNLILRCVNQWLNLPLLVVLLLYVTFSINPITGQSGDEGTQFIACTRCKGLLGYIGVGIKDPALHPWGNVYRSILLVH
ncbi:MAG: hypothetical protein GY737_26380 [Desulfobacteraceae bacterium]|nr:hypothetical protein [Desulfobacteraceae bacterium]